MKEQKKSKQIFNGIMLYAGALGLLVVMNVIILSLIINSTSTVALLVTQTKQLEQDQAIISSSHEIFEQYKDDIIRITEVFPNEESMLNFIRIMESEIQAASSLYSIKFSSETPLKEQNRLYFFLSVSMKTDMEKFLAFLSSVENLPYMTHIVSITGQTPGGITEEMDVVLGMKIYVQDPFFTQ